MDVPTTSPVPPARPAAAPDPDCAVALAQALRRLKSIEDEAASLGLDRVATRAALLRDLLERLLLFPSTPDSA